MKLSIKSTYLLVGLLSFPTISFAAQPVMKDALPSSGKVYAGIFGGWGSSANDIDTKQYGTAFFTEAEGGPLAVNAFGQVESDSTSYLGLQLGYQAQNIMLWGGTYWSLAPAIELEGYYLNKRSLEGTLTNDTDRLDGHEFDVTYPMKRTIFLTNILFNFNHPRLVVNPYIGVGIGAAIVDISGADATQTDPLEAGVNHYNSNNDDSDTTFAGQVKVGLSYNFTHAFSVFAEYRWLYLSNTDFTFGSTVYPTHAATSSWQVEMDPQKYNLGNIGIRVSL